MSNWTLDGSPCCVQSLTLGVAQTDSAVVELRAGMAAVPTEGSYVSLACDGEVMLYGRARSGRTVSGGRDAVRVQIDGPWADLEETVYQQTMKVVLSDDDEPGGWVLSDILSPEVQLGMTDAGALRTTLQEIAAIISYASGAGVPVTVSSTFTPQQIPVISMDGQSCAGCIMALLDYHPEVVAHFVYSAGAAVLHLTPLASLSVVTVAGGDGGADKVTGAAFKQVIDYKPGGVRIVYLRVGAFGRLEASTPDVSGTIGTQGKSRRVINWFVHLEGAEPGPQQTQQIRTRAIPENTDVSGKMNFWRAHLPWLDNSVLATGTAITEHTRTVDPPRVETDPVGEVPETWSTDPDDYPRELVDGTIQPWMAKLSAAITIKAKFAWSGGTLTDAVKAIFGPLGTEVREYSVQLTGTDASTKNYATLAAGAAIPDFPAAGLAASFMAAFAGAVWEGGLTLTGEDQPIIRPGSILNVTGYEAAWGSMAAVVQSVSYDPQGHSLTVSCGPPRVMGFGDFYELQRVFKKKKYLSTSAAYETRTSAQPSGGGKVTGGQQTPMRSVTTPGGGGGSALAGALQTLLRRSGTDWNIGITPGIISAVDSHTPTIEPDGTAMVGLPSYWWDDTLAGTDVAHTRFIYLKVLIDDTDDYELILTAAEIHLLADHPATVFSPGAYQYIHIGTAAADGDGNFTATSHISGSLRALRRGGPGCPVDVYVP
jgi:hypothetical protein